MRRLLLLAVAARALQPLTPCRATRRHLVSVQAEPEPDVDELKRQAEALRAEVETLQAEAQAVREEELRRNPPPAPKPKRERPKPAAIYQGTLCLLKSRCSQICRAPPGLVSPP